MMGSCILILILKKHLVGDGVVGVIHDHRLGRAPTVLRASAVDPHGRQPERLGRHVIVVEALGAVDETRARASLAILQARFDTARAVMARLLAELENLTGEAFFARSPGWSRRAELQA